MIYRRLIISFLFLSIGFVCQAQDQQLYYVKVMRAAPGELLELIELLKEDIRQHKTLGIEEPRLMRHSQGDQWDLLVIFPVKAMDTYLSNALLTNSKTFQKPYGHQLNDKISFQEEGFFYGPIKADFDDWMSAYSYYHVEIFTALAGKQDALLEEREMENVYLEALDRRPNFIFERAFGTSWDIFTIGCYDDIKDYASAGDIPFEEEDAAAKKAGFQSVNTIGSYLREFLLEHHDTLAGAVRP